MPIVVDVVYRNSKMNDTIGRTIKSAVRRFGIINFSTPAFKMEDETYSVLFRPASSLDQLSHDIIVSVPLCHFKERSVDPDDLAANLAASIAEALRERRLGAGLTVQVMIPMGVIGWGDTTVPAIS